MRKFARLLDLAEQFFIVLNVLMQRLKFFRKFSWSYSEKLKLLQTTTCWRLGVISIR